MCILLPVFIFLTGVLTVSDALRCKACIGTPEYCREAGHQLNMNCAPDRVEQSSCVILRFNETAVVKGCSISSCEFEDICSACYTDFCNEERPSVVPGSGSENFRFSAVLRVFLLFSLIKVL